MADVNSARRVPLPAALAVLFVAQLVALPALADTPDPLLRYFTPAEIAAADDYVRPLYLRFAFELVWGFGFTGLFLGLRWNARLKHRCEALAERWGAKLARVPGLSRLGAALTKLWGDATWAGALLFVFAFVAIMIAVDLPSDFYFGWVYERKQGLSVQPLGRWVWDAFKAFVLYALSLAALAFGLYGLARRRRNWWLLLGVPCAVLLLGAGLLDPYRVQLFRDYAPVPEGPTRDRIAQVMKKAGVEYEGLYSLKMAGITRRVNAFIAGQGPSRRIVLWDTLLAAMDTDEVANVVAHEIGHLRDRTPGRLVLASVCLVPYLLLVAWFLRRFGRSGRLGFQDDRDVASLPAVFLLVGLVGLVANPISAAFNRKLEIEADAYALKLLEEPEAFRSMMVKLARANRADLHPPAWVRVMLLSHPPMLERIELAEGFAREKGIALREPSPGRFGTAPVATGP